MGILTNVVISIVLLSMMAGVTVSLIPFDKIMGEKVLYQVESSFSNFEKAVDAYQTDNRQYIWVEDCPPGSVSGAPECVYDRKVDPANDGTLDTAAWESALIPQYMRYPAMDNTFVWSMGTNADGLYVCVSAPYEIVNKVAFYGLAKNNPSATIAVGGSCDPSTPLTSDGVESFTGSTIYATRYL